MLVDFDMGGQQEISFFTGGIIMDYVLAFCPEATV